MSSLNIILPADALEGTAAKVAQWLVNEGDQVTEGMPLLELETDKVTMEIFAEADGVIASILADVDTEVEQDTVLGTINTVAESAAPAAPAQDAPASAAESVAEPAVTAAPAATGAILDIALPADKLEGTAATVANWLVAVGEFVSEGDPVLELETDKVTMEIPAPADGTLCEIIAQVDEEVGPDALLGKLQAQAGTAPSATSAPAAVQAAASQPADTAAPAADGRCRRHLVGPAVRRLLKTNDLNIDLIPGSGRGGRVTRDDVLAYIENPTPRTQPAPAPAAKPAAKAAPVATTNGNMTSRMVPHTPMRKAIANHMVESLLHTSPHVTSVFEMDMGAIIEHRKQCKMGFDEAGVKLTFTAYFLAACVKAIHEVPAVNARFHEDALEIFENMNIGIGTALGDDGLVVPVVKDVQDMNLFQIATALQAQTEKARNGRLTPADMKDGTFTISNHGVSGSLFAAPIIINQPQVAILGIGKLEKRAVVEEVDGEDVIRIRPKCYVSLSIDHRAIDAHQTNMFLSHFVNTIENWGK